MLIIAQCCANCCKWERRAAESQITSVLDATREWGACHNTVNISCDAPLITSRDFGCSEFERVITLSDNVRRV